MGVTLQQVRKLLKPYVLRYKTFWSASDFARGGKLVLLEVTRPDILRTGFAMGLLPGWWLSELQLYFTSSISDFPIGSEEHRPLGPCMTPEKWHDLLARNGFSGIDLIFRDYESAVCHELDIMVSSAVAAPPDQPGSLNFIIVADSDSKFQQEVSLELQKRMQVRGHQCPDILSLDKVLMKENYADTCLIFLEELERPFLASLDRTSFAVVQRILTKSKGVLWASKGGSAYSSPEYGMIDGLGRVARAENDKLVLITAALDAENTSISRQVENICRIIQSTNFNSAESSHEPAFLEVDGMLQVGRLVEARYLSKKVYEGSLPFQSVVQTFAEAPPLEMNIGKLGLLDTIYFGEDNASAIPLAADEVEIQVRAVGLNFKDVIIALGKVPGNALGSECAGIVTRVGQSSKFRPGERVFAAGKNCFKTFARANSQFVFRIPDGLTFTESAALPATFVTAHVAIHRVARMERGESILIHAGAGGTGQAAIQVAKCLDARIFVTVGSEEKKQWLVDEYDIPGEQIFYSRDTTFAKCIQRMTGNGVDVIINSLAGKHLVASWECIAPFGRFIEIGKKNILENASLPMSSFEKNVSFNALDVSMWMRDRPRIIHKSMEDIIDLISKKKLHAARPLHVYSISDAENAFRFLQEGKSIGKIVIEIKSDAQVPVKNLLVWFNASINLQCRLCFERKPVLHSAKMAPIS